MKLLFEWDEAKSESNLKKHGISFDEAKTVFGDPLSLTIQDAAHSNDENRFVDVGLSANRRLLVVVYTERNPNIRIISARKATAAERRAYEKNDI
ncbi:MAG: BrnT family toxin [Armatimonadetes bacterium]|nr:BrnT family toxin [Armatimonadota bacterium]